jgi:hypothetical protein
MLKKTRILVLTVGLVGGVMLLATPAEAAEWVAFSLSHARLDYTVSGNNLKVREHQATDIPPNPTFKVEYVVDGDIQAIAYSQDPANYDFLLDVNLVQAGANNWTASGTFTFTDQYLTTAASATFTSTAIAFTPKGGATGELEVAGNLEPSSGSSILSTASLGDPWQYDGEFGDDLSVPGASGYDRGWLVTLKFGIVANDLDDFLSEDQLDLQQGYAYGEIFPAPAAVVLGFIGLSLVGWRMRRMA